MTRKNLLLALLTIATVIALGASTQATPASGFNQGMKAMLEKHCQFNATYDVATTHCGTCYQGKRTCQSWQCTYSCQTDEKLSCLPAGEPTTEECSEEEIVETPTGDR